MVLRLSATTGHWSRLSYAIANRSEIPVVETRTGLVKFSLPVDEGLRPCFSPGNEFIFVPLISGTVLAFDASTGMPTGELRGHTASVWAIAFSPDGKSVATSAHDRTVRLWDLKSGALRFTLGDLDDTVTSLAFSDDGQKLAAGGIDGRITIWDGTSETPLTVPVPNSEAVDRLAAAYRAVEGSQTIDDTDERLWNKAVRLAKESPAGRPLLSNLYISRAHELISNSNVEMQNPKEAIRLAKQSVGDRAT